MRALVDSRIYRIIEYNEGIKSYELSFSGNDRITMHSSRVTLIPDEPDAAIPPTVNPMPTEVPPEYNPETGTDETPPEGSPLPMALSPDGKPVTQPKKHKA